MTTRIDEPNEKQRRILAYLRTQVATQQYFKSRLIGQEVGLSAKEVGTNLGALTRRGETGDLDIERWGFTSGTTWKVTPAVAVSSTVSATTADAVDELVPVPDESTSGEPATSEPATSEPATSEPRVVVTDGGDRVTEPRFTEARTGR